MVRGRYQVDASGVKDRNAYESLALASSAVLETMYPRDGLAQEAVDSYVRDGGTAKTTLDAIRVCLVLPERKIERAEDVDEWIADQGTVYGTFFGHRNLLSEFFPHAQQSGTL